MQKKSSGLAKHSPAVFSLVSEAPGERTLTVNTAGAGAPSDVYVADVAWPEVRRSAVSLFFAKEGSEPGRLHSRLEVRYSIEAFTKHLWTNSRELHAAMRVRAQSRSHLPDLSGDRLGRGLPANKEHSVWANFETIARVGSEAYFEFFHLSPKDVAAFNQTGEIHKLRLKPVVAVLTTSDELYRLLEESAPLVQMLEPFFQHPEAL